MPRFEEFRLPDVGEGLTEADIVQWHVAVGDDVVVNQQIVEIETAKSLVELPAPHTGRLSALHAEEGQTVAVGELLVTFDVAPEEQEDSEPAADEGSDQAETSPAAEQPAAQQDDEEGDEQAVLVGYGARATSPRRRARRSRPRPTAASQHARQDEPAGTAPATAGTTTSPTPAPAAATGPAPATAPAPADTSETGGGRALAKPPVRKLAKDLDVDLTTITATGPNGTVTRDDVIAHASTRGATAHEPASGPASGEAEQRPWLADGTASRDGRSTRVPVKSVRKRTAEAVVSSAFTAPHVTLFHTLDITASKELIERLKADRAFAEVKVTPMLLVAKALLLAVRRHPQINATWDDEAQEIIYKHYVNLGLAAATPRGLVVPNIKDADRLDLPRLAEEIGVLTADAREGRTTPAAMSDGTITITNVGVFGIDTGTPILNPGESAILAFGALRQQPWVHDGEVKPRWVTQLALSFDHRLIDGELGARLLADIAAVLEDPALGLVWG